jgi:hypothetical protein
MVAGRTTLWRLLVLNWPRIVGALRLAERYVREHPETEAWLRQRLVDLRAQMVAAQRRRGSPSAEIRATLGVVRRLIGEVSARHGGGATGTMDVWTSRADNIDRALDLADAGPLAGRSESLERLRTETDVLLSDVIGQLTHFRSLPPGGLDAAPPDTS